jgi:hypothetical protein
MRAITEPGVERKSLTAKYAKYAKEHPDKNAWGFPIGELCDFSKPL